MAATMMAAGPAIPMFTLNLSFMEQPWEVVAAIVVSEMKDRLSPKKEPPTISAATRERGREAWPAIPLAMGIRATMVPTEEPMDIEIRQDARNSPARRNFGGTMASVRLTVDSTLPMALAEEAKAPASMNIQTIRRMFLSPAPFEKMPMRSAILPLEMMTEYAEATRKATVTGTE